MQRKLENDWQHVGLHHHSYSTLNTVSNGTSAITAMYIPATST